MNTQKVPLPEGGILMLRYLISYHLISAQQQAFSSPQFSSIEAKFPENNQSWPNKGKEAKATKPNRTHKKPLQNLNLTPSALDQIAVTTVLGIGLHNSGR